MCSIFVGYFPGAGLTVRDSSGVVMEPESEQDFTYLLKNGDYTYTVTCKECESEWKLYGGLWRSDNLCFSGGENLSLHLFHDPQGMQS